MEIAKKSYLSLPIEDKRFGPGPTPKPIPLFEKIGFILFNIL